MTRLKMNRNKKKSKNENIIYEYIFEIKITTTAETVNNKALPISRANHR